MKRLSWVLLLLLIAGCQHSDWPPESSITFEGFYFPHHLSEEEICRICKYGITGTSRFECGGCQPYPLEKYL